MAENGIIQLSVSRVREGFHTFSFLKLEVGNVLSMWEPNLSSPLDMRCLVSAHVLKYPELY